LDPSFAFSPEQVASALLALFDQALTYGVDEVGIRGSVSASTHLGRDLAAMIRGVKHDVSQDILDGAVERLALAVVIAYVRGKCGRRELAEIILPQFRKFGYLNFALA
jgi:hypothetical protein